MRHSVKAILPSNLLAQALITTTSRCPITFWLPNSLYPILNTEYEKVNLHDSASPVSSGRVRRGPAEPDGATGPRRGSRDPRAETEEQVNVRKSQPTARQVQRRTDM